MGGGPNLSTPQVPMKTGLKLFGQAGDAAVKSKMGQLHEWEVMKPVMTKELAPSQKREALIYLMFLKKAVWKSENKWMYGWL